MKLVKILENADIDALNEHNIAEYVQTVNMVSFLKQAIIDPYTEQAKSMRTKDVFTGDDLSIKLVSRSSNQRMSDKQVLDMLTATLGTTQRNSNVGKQMYGVKHFGDTLAIDVTYVLELMDSLQGMIIGTTETQYLKPKGKLADIVRLNSGRFVTHPNLTGNPEEDAKLYVAADKQSKHLATKIITPFDKTFKANAEKDTTKTVFDTKKYGGLIVQVKSVPRQETDYGKVVSALDHVLVMYSAQGAAQGVNNKVSFWNDKLVEPRVYVSIEALQRDITKLQSKKNTKFRQEISVLYAPTDAVIMTF